METLETTTQTKWTADKVHSALEFSVKHMMISTVKGLFKDFDITVESKGDNFGQANITVTVPVGTIETNNEQRNQHLTSADFFDVANHPTATFKSNAVEKTGENEYKVHGDLTLRGVTKPVDVDVEYNGIAKDPYGNTKAGFEFKTAIDRQDFGLGWNVGLEAGGVMVSPTVKIHGGVQLLKQKDEAAQ